MSSNDDGQIIGMDEIKESVTNQVIGCVTDQMLNSEEEKRREEKREGVTFTRWSLKRKEQTWNQRE